MAWGESPSFRRKEPLNLTGTYTYIYVHICEHHVLKAQAKLSFISVQLHPINLPDMWHEAAHCQRGRRWWGRGQRHRTGSLVSSLWVIMQQEYTERKALFEFVCPLFPFSLVLSLPASLPLPPILDMHAGWAHRGVEGKQLCLAVINPQYVIHKLFTVNSLSVYKCGSQKRKAAWMLK